MLSQKELKLFTSLKKKKYREQEKLFMVEGYHNVEECLKSKYIIERIVISEVTNQNHYNSIQSLAAKKRIQLDYLKEHKFQKLVETQNSQGIIAVVHKELNYKIDLNNAYLIVALDEINDPGNLGTILRTSYWFNVDYLLLSSNCVDLYNSKVIRSSQGAIFHLKILENVDLMTELQNLNNDGFDVFLLDLKTSKLLDSINFKNKNIFVFGNESTGISKELLNLNFEKIKIKGYSQCESLNVSISTAITLSYYKTLISKFDLSH